MKTKFSLKIASVDLPVPFLATSEVPPKVQGLDITVDLDMSVDEFGSYLGMVTKALSAITATLHPVGPAVTPQAPDA